MPNNTTLHNRQMAILGHFKQLNFRAGNAFFWSANEQIIYYAHIQSLKDIWRLLHEIAHALLGHSDYQKDIQLLQKEAEAWHLAAVELAPIFKLEIDAIFIEDQLNSYREWLHARSLCPMCGQTALQQTTSIYQCVNCLCSWQVNDARFKQLRRTKLHYRNRFAQLSS